MSKMVTPVKASKPALNGQREPSDHPLANCKPRGDRVVVKLDIKADRSTGGVLYPDSTQAQRQNTGTVVRVGPGLRGPDGKRILIDDLEPGMRVVITSYAGLEIDNGESRAKQEPYVLLRDDDVCAEL